MLTLIDGNSLLFRAYYGIHSRLTRRDGTPVNAVYGFCNMLLNILADAAPGDIFICVFDAHRKNWRNDIYPEYKANRTDTPADLVAQIEITRNAVRSMGMPVLVVDNVEADDVIATIARQECFVSTKTRIATSDKDLMQLVDDCVFLYDGMKEKEIRAPQVLEKFGVRPDQVIDVQALMGDSSDNVPGVPGIGPKKAAELINQFGNLDNLYNNLDEVANDRIRGLLSDHKQMAQVSRQLVSLKTDVDLPEFSRDAFHFDTASALKYAETEIESPALIQKIKKLFGDANNTATISTSPVAVPNSLVGHEIITTETQLKNFLGTVRDIIALDTETTGLNQMVDKVVGISLATNDNTAAYIPIRHNTKSPNADLFGEPTAPKPSGNQLGIDTVKALLWPILINPDIIKVGHNLKYDLHILENEGWDSKQITSYDDTMLLSYVLHGTAHLHNMDELAKLYLGHENIKFDSLFPPKTKDADKNFASLDIADAAPYAAEDARITFSLYKLFRAQLGQDDKLLKLYENCDRPLLQVLLKMERDGVLVNQSRLHELSGIFHGQLSVLEKEIWILADQEFNIASPKQLAEVLYDKLNLPHAKNRSTDADALGELAEDNPIVAKILEWRSLAKLAGTYTDALPRQIASDGRIHTTYLQTSTNTGRLSSRDPNLQNIPIRTELGEQIRKCFVAPTGRVLISADYSQIQLRLLAHVADVKAFKETFAKNADIHEQTARKIFNIPDGDPVPKNLRHAAKTVNFSIIYGISSFGLAAQLDIGRGDAQKIIDSYLAGLPEIKEYIEKTKQFAMDNGCVYTPWGRRIELPGIRNPRMRAYAMRAAINAPIQGFEADLMRYAMTVVPYSPHAKMIMQVHDEMVFECDEQYADEYAALVKQAMESVANLSVPLLAETSIGKEWGK